MQASAEKNKIVGKKAIPCQLWRDCGGYEPEQYPHGRTF